MNFGGIFHTVIFLVFGKTSLFFAPFFMQQARFALPGQIAACPGR